MLRRPFAPSLIAFSVALFLLSCAPSTFPTPLEEGEEGYLTSHEDMLRFLGELRDATGAFTMEPIGASVEERDLVLLHFPGADGPGEGTGEKLKVLIFAQQHGNEPSGKEAAIALARDIATGAFSDILGHVDFYLIPQVNPDGSEARQRTNADGKDLNRDHIALFTPEVLAVHQAFQGIMPEVVLDVHEYGITSSAWLDIGVRKNFGQQIGALSNANMSMALRSYALDRVIPEMRETLSSRDVSLNRYLVSSGPAARFRYSTTALNDGRNSTGIYNALTFLIEGRNGLSVEENIRERARQQLETMKAFLSFFDEHAAEVKTMVAAEQAKLSGDTPPEEVALVMDYVEDPDRPTVTVGVVDAETGAESTMTIEYFHPIVEATLFVPRPLGYAIPAQLTGVIEALERHGIPMTPSDGSTSAIVESYRIESVTPTRKEDKDFLEVGVVSRRGAMELPADHVLVWCAGIQSNLIVSLLEPQSQWGLAPLPEFSSLLEVGSDYPILRILERED